MPPIERKNKAIGNDNRLIVDTIHTPCVQFTRGHLILKTHGDLMKFPAVISTVLLCLIASMSAEASPSQFIAKQYTEALGRAPDSGGWQAYSNYIAQNSCSASSLGYVASALYNSSEFSNLGYDNTEKVMAAYRGILNRDADQGGLDNFTSQLNNGSMTFSSLVNVLLTSPEFTNNVSSICAPLSYGWGTTAAPKPTTNGPGFAGGTSNDLQQVLNAATSGSIVYLAPRAVIYANTKITVPEGVTLATYWNPNRQHYARMARIVRTALVTPAGTPGDPLTGSNSELITLKKGAKLQSVWVSGQRQILGYLTSSNSAVNVTAQSAGSISDSRLENSAGWTNISLYGNAQGYGSCNTAVTGNLITGYSNTHTRTGNDAFHYTDGVSSFCENTSITNNNIVDPSDVGVVIFAYNPNGLSSYNQTSQATNNTVISAGVPAYGGLGFDPNQFGAAANFNGAKIDSNTLWAAPDSRFDVGLIVGSVEWFGSNSTLGSGATMTNNTTAGISTPMRQGIAIDGMVNATVQNNSLLRASPTGTFTCPEGDVLADVASGRASGTLPPYNQASMDSCVLSQ